MPLIQVNNRAVHVSEMNKEARETIIMIHGMFTNLSIFYFSIAPKLSTKYHIVLYDLKSHGLSEKSHEGYDLKTMSNDLIALMDTLNISEAHLIGYSFGGLIALYTAIHFPEKTGKLAIIDSPITDNETEDVIEKYGSEFLEHYMQTYTSSTDLKPSKRQLEKSKKLYEFLLHETTMPKDLVTDKDFSTEEAMKSVSNNTLLLYGQQSDCLQDGEFLHSTLPNSIFFTGKGDHNLPVQNPEWISNKLNNFFN